MPGQDPAEVAGPVSDGAVADLAVGDGKRGNAGRHIWRQLPEHASFSHVSELQSAAARIAEADPEPAVGLYETFIAAGHEKGEEGDGQSI